MEVVVVVGDVTNAKVDSIGPDDGADKNVNGEPLTDRSDRIVVETGIVIVDDVVDVEGPTDDDGGGGGGGGFCN